MRTTYFEMFQGAETGNWHWRLVAANGKIVFFGASGYVNKDSCLRAIRALPRHLLNASEIRVV